MITFYIQGKKAFNLADIIFIFAGTFIMGFVAGVDKYLGGDFLKPYFWPPLLIMLFIYIIKLILEFNKEPMITEGSDIKAAPRRIRGSWGLEILGGGICI